MDSSGSLACRAYPDTGTGTSKDVFNLLAIRGPTHGEGKPGIEPRSSDPQSSPLPLRHCGGLIFPGNHPTVNLNCKVCSSYVVWKSRGQSSNTRFVRRHLVSAQRLGIINIFTQTSALRKRCVIVCEGIYTLENEYHHWRYVYSSLKTLRIIMIYSVIY